MAVTTSSEVVSVTLADLAQSVHQAPLDRFLGRLLRRFLDDFLGHDAAEIVLRGGRLRLRRKDTGHDQRDTEEPPRHGAQCEHDDTRSQVRF